MWSLSGRASLLLRRTYDRLLLPNTFYHSEHASLKFVVSRRELSSQDDANSLKDQDGLEESHCEFTEKEGLPDLLPDKFDEERKEKIRQNISRAWRKINLNPHNPECKAELVKLLPRAKASESSEPSYPDHGQVHGQGNSTKPVFDGTGNGKEAGQRPKLNLKPRSQLLEHHLEGNTERERLVA
ncbi:uncharacterized protein LOC130941140 isoform X3 [Arachis stenosperma]|uniref:uncharacterized protein LOC130941140 isoform X3 n=1 Tax=Arachis stenosperma TaxID=217475 RepID=UPI0025ACD4E1|nr:uncharacterized protein LOC130941140 isoform X3 [Arachis stenosperma]XP_057725523.1 uncharacterized protein LOC130941140 isoform X3 [Arachis stenosperma]